MLIMNKLKLQEQYYDVILYRSRLSVSNMKKMRNAHSDDTDLLDKPRTLILVLKSNKVQLVVVSHITKLQFKSHSSYIRKNNRYQTIVDVFMQT